MTKKKKEYSPYCELCTGCGEDGCCSHLSCFSALIKNSKCDYGERYLRNARYSQKMYELGFNIIEKLRNKEITSNNAVIEFDEKRDLIWDEVYK